MGLYAAELHHSIKEDLRDRVQIINFFVEKICCHADLALCRIDTNGMVALKNVIGTKL